MQCPSCGLNFDEPNPERCPRCGYVLAAPTMQYMAGGAPQQPGAPPPAGGYVAPQPPNDPYGTAASTPVAPTPPAPPPGYVAPPQGAPAGPAGYLDPTPAPPTRPYAPQPSYGPPPGYTPTGAPQPVFPQPVYPQPGSQAATQPTPQPGYPQAAYTPPGYAQTGAPPVYGASPYAQTGAPRFGVSQPGAIPQGYPVQPGTKPVRKRGAGVVIGVIVAVVVLLVACGGGAFVGLRAFGSQIPGLSQLGIGGNPAATSTATSPSSTPGSVIYQNTFAANATGWPALPGECFYASGGYHAVDSHACYAPIPDQADLDVTVSVQQIKGQDGSQYGIVFRREGPGSSYQLNIISKGKWEFSLCKSNTCTKVIDYTTTSALHAGLNTTNTLEVIAKGWHFEFFINGTNVGHYDDATHAHASGKVGLVVTKNMECVYTNLTIKRPA